MNCLCCCCCCCWGQASWEKEINIGFVYVNAMLKHHKPHTSVSTETTKYDIFAAWFRLIRWFTCKYESYLSLACKNYMLYDFFRSFGLSAICLSMTNFLLTDKFEGRTEVQVRFRYGWEWGTFWLSAVCLALCQKFDESKNVQNVQVVGRFLGCRRAF